MKKLDKIKLVDMIATELQKQMTFAEIDSYFEAYKIPTDHFQSFYSKKVYVKEVLPKINDETILEIADELKLEHSYGKMETDSIEKKPVIKVDSTLWKTGHFKLFLSHLADFKVQTSHLKIELEKYGISSFVAHEDIEPGTEWQIEIEKGLFSMDALCAILMPGFKESLWTDQEIGFALGRDLLVIPVRKDLDPYGFIGKYQGIQSKGKKIGEVAKAIFSIVSTNDKTKKNYINIITELFLLSNGKVEISNRLNAIRAIKEFPKERVVQIRERVVENESFKNVSILNDLKEFFEFHGFDGINIDDFNISNTVDYDDLPF
jgi:hypothetical protein